MNYFLKGKRPAPVVLSLCWLALALRLVGLSSQSLWRDEVDALRFASRPVVELLTGFVTPGENGPLYYLLLRLWTIAAGRGEFALRFFSVLWGVAAIPLVFYLARQLFPRAPSIALLSSLLAAVSPYLVWYGQEGKMYALVVWLALASMTLLLAADTKGGWHRWLAYGVVTGAGAYVHFAFALLFAPQMLMLSLSRLRRGQVRAWGWLGGAMVFFLVCTPLLTWQVPMMLKGASTGYQFVPLPAMVASLVQSYTLGVAPHVSWWLVLPFAVAASAGVLLPTGDRPSAARRAQLLSWLLLPVIVFYLLTLQRPMYTARYLILVLPAFLILIAHGIVSLARQSRAVAGLVLMTVLSLSLWGVWLQGHTPLKADFRAATRTLAEQMGRDDLLLFQIPHGRHSFEYYYSPVADRGTPGKLEGRPVVFVPVVMVGERPRFRWVDGLFTNGGMTEAEVDRRMAALVGDSRIVWLVESESQLWDERCLVRAWLDRHGKGTEKTVFVRVTLVRYELR